MELESGHRSADREGPETVVAAPGPPRARRPRAGVPGAGVPWSGG